MAQAATAQGTAAYARRFAGRAAEGHFRPAAGLTLSSIGLGTYLGGEDDDTDRAYREAIQEAVASGLNVLDTAINYRLQRSERALGQAVTELGRRGFGREGLVVCTKGGYVPARHPVRYFEEEIARAGLARSEDLVAGCHCLAPGYIRHQVAASLGNLGLRAVDVYYLHNPEQQLDEVDPRTFRTRMRAAFEALEREVADGRVGAYGTATWNGYRVSPGTRGWLSLEGLVETAREVGGADHHFRFVQLPFSLVMTEAFGEPSQTLEGRPAAPLAAASALGLAVVTSAPMLQGRLTQGLPDEIARAMPGLATDAQRAIQFARSAPGATTALVGMSQLAHVAENLALVGVPPLSADTFRNFFSLA